MAYQSVGTPRFYIDHGIWLHSLGLFSPPDEISSLLGLNPTKVIELTTGYRVPRYAPINYVAYLGHNGGTMYPEWNDENTGGVDTEITSHINGQSYSSDNSVQYSGFSIFFITDDEQDRMDAYIKSGEGTTIGSISVGSIYEMSHSADLSLTLGYETGTKTIETRGGASLSNTMWRPPMWGDLGAWELSDPNSATLNQTLAHSSRRTWSLSFSFLNKTNTFPKYNALNRLIDQNETLPDDETLLTSDDFFSVVWNKVGTALPFIFQPDKDVSEFAICKFTNNFSFQQTAPNLYSVKMKIREVW